MLDFFCINGRKLFRLDALMTHLKFHSHLAVPFLFAPMILAFSALATAGLLHFCIYFTHRT